MGSAIHSLMQTFDQSLLKIFQRVQKIWSGQESVTEGQTDRWTDRWTDGQTKAISIIPHPLHSGGLIVEEMKERDREEKGTGLKVKKQKKLKHSLSTLIFYKDSRPCPTVSQYQLDTSVT